MTERWPRPDAPFPEERFASEDLHRALFEVPPEPRTLEELEEGIRRYVESRFSRLRADRQRRDSSGEAER
jgi:hypothetical protein